MDSLHLDLNQLATETLELSESINGKFSFDEIIGSRSFHKYDHSLTEGTPTFRSESFHYPETPGVVYYLKKGKNTFLIRGISTLNIAKTYDEIFNKNNSSSTYFKIDEEIPKETFRFFETDSLNLADILAEQIFNRRFPLIEDVFYQFNDSGLSWYIKDQDNTFVIYFNRSIRHQAEMTKVLGPIGDNVIAHQRFNFLKDVLCKVFYIDYFFCDDKSLKVSTNSVHSKKFESFKNIFLKGDFNLSDEYLEDNGLSRTVYYYLKEIAIVRKFWIVIQDSLDIPRGDFLH